MFYMPLRRNICQRWFVFFLFAFLFFFFCCRELYARSGCPQSREDSYLSFSLARIYFNQGDFERSEEHLREAAILDSCSAPLYAEAAMMFLKMRKDKAAEEFASLALEIDPDEIGALKVQVVVQADSALRTRDDELMEKSIVLCRKAIEREPNDPQMRYIMVKLYLEKNDFERCAESLREYLVKFPQSMEPLFLAAEVMSGGEKLGRAEEIADELSKGDTLDASVIMKIADILEGGKDLKAAHLLYQAYLKNHQDKRILLRDAMVLYSMDSYEEVMLMLDKEEMRSDESADVLHLQARVQSRVGKMNDARDSYTKLLNIEPGNEEAIVEFGEFFEYMGDFGNAIQYFKSSLSRMGTTEDAVRKKLALSLRIASLYLELNDPQSAFSALSDSRKYGAEKDPLYYIISSEIAERKSSRKALKIIEGGKKIVENDKGLVIREAEIYAQHTAEKAEELLRKFIEKEGKSKESYLRTSRILIRVQQFQRAWQILKEGLDMYQSSDMYLEAGALMERWGHYQEAERFLERSIDLDSANATALNYLGYMLAVRGEKLEQALAYAMKALEIEEYNGAFIDSLGYIYLKLERIELARKYLLSAAEIFPFDPEIREHLGDLYYSSGDVEEAIREWKRSIDYKIENKEAVIDKIKKAGSEIKIHEK